MFVVVAKLRVKPEDLVQFTERLENHVRLTRSEGRCRAFHVNRSTQDDCEFLYYEEYDDEAAFNEHINSRRVEEHINNTSSMIDGDVWFAQWDRISDPWE